MHPINLRSGVTENILSSIYNVDPDIKYRLLNKQIYDESKPSFYNQYCDKPVTNSEIIRYLKTSPKKIGLVLLNEVDNNDDPQDPHFATQIEFNYLTKNVLRPKYHGEINLIKAVLNQDNEYSIVNKFESSISPDINQLINIINVYEILDYDLFTIYNIYKNRHNCMRVNPMYAKQKLLGFLKLLGSIVDEKLLDLYYYYEYLLLNCFIFDISENYTELTTLRLNPKEPLLLENASKREVILYLNEAIEDPLKMEEYIALKKFLLFEFDRLLILVTNHIHTLN